MPRAVRDNQTPHARLSQNGSGEFEERGNLFVNDRRDPHQNTPRGNAREHLEAGSSGANTPQRKFHQKLQIRLTELENKYKGSSDPSDIATAYINDLASKLNRRTDGNSAHTPRRAELAAYFTILRNKDDGEVGISEIKNYVLSTTRSAQVKDYFGWKDVHETGSKVNAYAVGILNEEIGRRAESISQSPKRDSHDTSSSSSSSPLSTPPPVKQEKTNAPFATGQTPASSRQENVSPKTNPVRDLFTQTPQPQRGLQSTHSSDDEFFSSEREHTEPFNEDQNTADDLVNSQGDARRRGKFYSANRDGQGGTSSVTRGGSKLVSTERGRGSSSASVRRGAAAKPAPKPVAKPAAKPATKPAAKLGRK